MSFVSAVSRVATQCAIVIDRQEEISVRVPVISWRAPEYSLSGRSKTTAPLVASRLGGGATPLAHRLASIMAIEDAAGVKRDIPESARKYRELCLIADTARAHARNALYSTLPDIMTATLSPEKRGLFGMREKYGEAYARLSRLLEVSSQIGDLLHGGPHAYRIIPGGVAGGLTPEQVAKLGELATEGVALSRFVLELYEKLYEANTQLVKALGVAYHNHASLGTGEFSLTGSRISVVKPDGGTLAEFEACEFFSRIRLWMEPWSYARFSFYRESGWPEGAYRVGPLARINNTQKMGTRLADEALSRFRKEYGRPAHAPMLYSLARAIELLWCYEKLEEAVANNGKEVLLNPGRIDCAISGEGLGVGIVEAPQGLLVHEYETARDGRIERARVLTPLEQNNHGINRSCTVAAQQYKDQDEATILNAVRMVLRCYDP